MLVKRGFLVLVVSFSLVLVGGAAMAAVGFFSGDDASEGPLTALSDGEATGIFEEPGDEASSDEPAEDEPAAEEPAEEPAKDEPAKDEPAKDEPAKDEPARDEPADEPADEKPSEEPKADEPDITPPELVITSPSDGAHVDDEVITFKGEVEPGAVVSWSKYDANLTDGGAWSIALKLAPGKNVMVFVAEDAAGNAADASVTVYYDKPEPKGDEPKDESEFSAHQKWEVVDGSPAINVYWGTADPGAKVWVGSDYGSHHVYAGEAGGWELEAAFDAKCNKWFGVVVESGEHRKVFEMKRVCAEAGHEFSANQKWEVVDGEPTENKYWGTAEPGTTVWVGSDHGSNSTAADAGGGWLLWVTFDAPCNKWFGVVVESGDHRKEFEMKRACAEEAATVEFTANQQYGECAEEVPYDVFWGTAEPYSTIWVESAFGVGDTVVNGEGHWEILVEFPNAPRDETFDVGVGSSAGGSKTFSFIAIGTA